MAVRDLWSNKTRSFVTALSMACGMAVLAGMLSIVEGQKKEVELLLAETGGCNTMRAALCGPYQRPAGSVDWDAVLDWTEQGVEENQGAMVQIVGTGLDLRGATHTFERFGSLEVAEGRFLCPWDEVSKAPVAVVGSKVASQFGKDAVGSRLDIAGYPFTIVGRLRSKADVSHFVLGTVSVWKDNLVLIPFSVAVKGFPKQIHMAELYAEGDRRTPPQKLFPILGESQLEIVDNRDTIEYDTALVRMMPGVWAIILVSVFLSSAGVVNVMTSGVTERVVEIGVRRAVGASPADLTAQFVVEGSLCGLLGSGLGYAMSAATVEVVVRCTALPAAVAPWGIVLCFLVGPAAGMLSGFIPAVRAQRIDPAEALRAE